jgi:hypothetical protein
LQKGGIVSIAAAVGVLLASGSLVLNVRSPQSTVLVGEPIKLVVEWNARGTVRTAVVDDRESVRVLTVRVHSRSGALVGIYREEEVFGDTDGPRKTVIQGGASMITSMYLVFGGYLGEHRNSCLFERPGEYTLTLEYRPPDGVFADSNAIAFSVVEPTGSEREVLDAVRERAWMLRGGQKTDGLLEKYPDSRYLQYAKVERMKSWNNALVNGQDPYTRAPQGHKGREALRNWKADESRRLVTGFLATDSWGVFDEERLTWAALYMELAGDKVSAAAFRRELRARFPGTKGARQAEGYRDQ